MVEETLKSEMRRRAPGLVDRSGLAETVDGAKLEELRARLEVPGAARGEGLEGCELQFDGHSAECKTGL
jgi:hypothetical protein